jgi:hypothetical protein
MKILWSAKEDQRVVMLRVDFNQPEH